MRRRVAGRLRTAKEIESRLKRTLSPVRHRYANELRRRDIRQLLDAAADQGIKREAEKRRQTIGAMFRWALSQDIVEIDPTGGLAAYDPGTPGDRVLTVKEIERLWRWLCSDALPPDPADILKLELLTGARCGEISGLCVEEIDCDEWIWTLPAARSKNQETARHAARWSGPTDHPGKAFHHSVRATIQDRDRHALASHHIGNHLLNRRRKLPIEKFTSHDLRRTVATMLAERASRWTLLRRSLATSRRKETRTLVRHYVRTDLIERKKHMLCTPGMHCCRTLWPAARLAK